jgi:hypothetical protein
MKRTTLIVLFAISVGWLAFAVAGSRDLAAARGAAQGDIQRQFSVLPGGKLVMDVEPGAIEVRSGGGSQITADVIRKADRRSEAQEEELLSRHEVNFEQQGNTLLIRAKFRDSEFRRWRNNGLNVRYVVTVPTEFNLDLKTSGGGIQVDDLRGEVRARTSGGGLRFGRIEGPVVGNTSGGGITLVGCKGRVEIKTSGGGIDIGSGSGELTAETSGGGIKIENFVGNAFVRTSGGSIRADRIEGALDASTSGGPIVAAIRRQPSKASRLHTSGGGITLELDESLSLNIDAQASGGSVSTELPIAVLGELRKDSLHGTLNGGGQALSLQASGGSIQLRKLRGQQ